MVFSIVKELLVSVEWVLRGEFIIAELNGFLLVRDVYFPEERFPGIFALMSIEH